MSACSNSVSPHTVSFQDSLKAINCGDPEKLKSRLKRVSLPETGFKTRRDLTSLYNVIIEANNSKISTQDKNEANQLLKEHKIRIIKIEIDDKPQAEKEIPFSDDFNIEDKAALLKIWNISYSNQKILVIRNDTLTPLGASIGNKSVVGINHKDNEEWDDKTPEKKMTMADFLKQRLTTRRESIIDEKSKDKKPPVQRSYSLDYKQMRDQGSSAVPVFFQISEKDITSEQNKKIKADLLSLYKNQTKPNTNNESKLVSDYISLEKKFNSLKTNHSELEKRHKDLQRDFDRISEDLDAFSTMWEKYKEEVERKKLSGESVRLFLNFIEITQGKEDKFAGVTYPKMILSLITAMIVQCKNVSEKAKHRSEEIAAIIKTKEN